jgi:hypothetical protein
MGERSFSNRFTKRRRASSSGRLNWSGDRFSERLPHFSRCAVHVFPPPVGLLHFGEHHLDLGQAGFQHGIFAGEGVGIHGSK